MQAAKLNCWSFWLSLTGGGALPPPKNRQVLMAASNTGPLNGIPPTLIVSLPTDWLTDRPSPPAPFVGSGKFGTPCARMHSDIFSCGLDAALAGLGPEPPH